MPLTPGTRLGPYEIGAQIGVGGMGEVYRATDTKLKRPVAIKTLPAAVADDRERLARFRREAEVLAALNHPHIAAIYGIDDSTSTVALVMELVEGPTLADLLARGPLALDEAVPIARQIAEAPETAHDAGIVHRDLKPANIKVKPDGSVKVLDFGLAKGLDAAGGLGSHPDGFSRSPTMTSPVMTQAGVILGTAAYMAPEQAKGRSTDRRVDVWSYGCVFFEMLTGSRPFQGDDISDIVASILRDEPRWDRLPPDTPQAIRTLLTRCLQKDPQQRLPHLGSARLELAEQAWTREPASGSAAVGAGTRRGRLGWFALGTVLAGLAALAWRGYVFESDAPRSPVVRFAIAEPPGHTFGQNPGGPSVPMAVSPDGQWIAFSVDTALMIRRLETLESRPLPDTAYARFPFWSPDSRFLAFFTQRELKRIDLAGGAPQKIGDVDGGWGGAWSSDGTIAVTSNGSGLATIPAAGGLLRPLTLPATLRLPRSPAWLPDGRHLVVTDVKDDEERSASVWVVSVDGEEPVRLVEAARGGTYAHGRLLYVRDTTLFAQPFDIEALRLTEVATPVATPVESMPAGPAGFSVSTTGVLVFGEPQNSLVQLQIVDRAGQVLKAVGEPQPFQFPTSWSQDGQRILTSRRARGMSSDVSLWVHVLDRGVDTLIGRGTNGVFSPGADAVVAVDSTMTTSLIRWWLTDNRPPETLLPRTAWPTDWSSDGRYVVFQHIDPGTGFDLSIIDLESGNAVQPLAASRANDYQARLSRDRQWLAYTSDASGRPEIYAKAFQRDGETIQVSTAGGVRPFWRADGRECYYLSPDGVVTAVPMTVEGGRLKPGQPIGLFTLKRPPRLQNRGMFNGPYVPDGSGTRFVVAEVTNEQDRQLTVLVNWPATLAAQTSLPR